MSIALPALVITLLILPGILLSYSYRKGFSRSPIRLGTLQDEIGRGVLWAIPVNVIAFTLVDMLPLADIDLYAVLWLLTGFEGADEYDRLNFVNAVVSYPVQILMYLFSVNLFGMLSGYGLHRLVRYFRLDLKYMPLRFQNEWHYLFSGEARFFDVQSNDISRQSVREGLKEIDFTFVTMAVELGRDLYLYRGILTDYYFERGGHLDKIVIAAPQRLRVSTGDLAELDSPPDTMFETIEGDFFVIKYNMVKNLNIYYYSWVGSEEEEAVRTNDLVIYP